MNASLALQPSRSLSFERRGIHALGATMGELVVIEPGPAGMNIPATCMTDGGVRPAAAGDQSMTDQAVANRPPARRGDGLEPYEVFRQEKHGGPMVHGGNVLAPDPELAIHYAREMFGRRNESTRLWVVRRGDVHVLEDPDLLDPPLDRSFKKPGGYVMRDKLAAARGKAGTAKPGARATAHDTTGRRGTKSR